MARISIGLSVFFVVLLVYLISIGVWIATLEIGRNSVENVMNEHLEEIANNVRSQINNMLLSAEAITATNALQFKYGVQNISVTLDDPRGVDAERFLTAALAQLFGSPSRRSVTTVSLTTRHGCLFGVYTNADFTFTGRWEQYIDNRTDELVLLDYETYPESSAFVGQKKRLIAETRPYNSSERDWYTVVNVSDPLSSGWTSMYTMGNEGEVTSMLSQSHIALFPNGDLMGVVSVDMATGFVSDILRATMSQHEYFSFVVDARGAEGILLGTSDGSQLMSCASGQTLSQCPAAYQVFIPPRFSESAMVRRVAKLVLSAVGPSATWSDVDVANIDDDGLHIDVRSIHRNHLSWRVVIAVDKDVVFSDVRDNNVIMIIVQAVCALLELILCLLIAFGVRSPLRNLMARMGSLQRLEVESGCEGEVSSSALVPREVLDVEMRFEELRSVMAVCAKYAPREAILSQFADGKPHHALEPAMVTVLFVDIAGFTSMCEQLDVEAFALFVEHYYTVQTQTITLSGGVIDKYVGDVIMATWGAPTTVGDHELRCMCAALLLRGNMETEASQKLFTTLGIQCFVRVGAHRGDVLCGTVGSEQRAAYTVLGDVVNTAAQLGMWGKHLGAHILVSQEIVEHDRAHMFALRNVGEFQVLGKERGTRVYEIVALAQESTATVADLTSPTSGGADDVMPVAHESIMQPTLTIVSRSGSKARLRRKSSTARLLDTASMNTTPAEMQMVSIPPPLVRPKRKAAADADEVLPPTADQARMQENMLGALRERARLVYSMDQLLELVRRVCPLVSSATVGRINEYESALGLYENGRFEAAKDMLVDFLDANNIPPPSDGNSNGSNSNNNNFSRTSSGGVLSSPGRRLAAAASGSFSRTVRTYSGLDVAAALLRDVCGRYQDKPPRDFRGRIPMEITLATSGMQAGGSL
eukprot:PhM_4_TR13863/c0_g1_i2/m.30169/K01768/E4.6.1.1; adenylate cyclase